jgi:hypothetical protein
VDSSGNIYVVWEKDVIGSGTSGSAEVRFSQSADGGVHFSAPLTISNNTFGEIPFMALNSNGDINVAYWGSVAGTNKDDVFFTRSNDHGGTFSTPQNISSSSTGEGIPKGVAVDSNGNINVIWYSGCTTAEPPVLTSLTLNPSSTMGEAPPRARSR